MHGFEDFVSGIKDVKKEFGILNGKMDELNQHVAELIGATKDNTKVKEELTVAIRDLIRVTKERKG